MKRWISRTGLVIALASICPVAAANSGHTAPQAEPSYARWGQLAVAETKKKYPGAAVVDYRHVGRRTKSPTMSEETFKLWLRAGNREWGVYVRIVFETSSERVVSVDFQETDR